LCWTPDEANAEDEHADCQHHCANEMHGESVLECLALTDPGKLATIVAEKMSS
jgi:hypothetical protein